jgi:hypothetical protein
VPRTTRRRIGAAGVGASAGRRRGNPSLALFLAFASVPVEGGETRGVFSFFARFLFVTL